MSSFGIFPILIGCVMFSLTVMHALKDGRENRIQRILLLITLFLYGTLLEYLAIVSGHHYYASDILMLFGVVPISITLAWIGIIYSVMIIAQRLNLPIWLYILITTSIALSLDWGMDPIAVELGLWVWTSQGEFFGVPGWNFFGWFFIPISYLISYGLNWQKEPKRIQLLTINEIDEHNTNARKLYTVLLVIPISMGLLTGIGLIGTISFIYNMPLIALIIWLVFTIVGTSGVIIWKRRNLNNTQLIDLIPPLILLLIGINYVIIGFIINRLDLGFLMLFTGIPLLLAFIFTLQKKRI